MMRILSDPLIFSTSTAMATIGLAIWYIYTGRCPTRVLDQHTTKEFKLKEKKIISHNTCLYRFALPRKDDTLGLPVGQHILVVATIAGKEVSRSYTPTSSNEEKGYFDLLIKIIRAIVRDHKDKTKITLLFGNMTEDDILLKDELDQLAKNHPEQFKVYHVLNYPPKGWTQGTGFINKEILHTWLPKPSCDTQILICGPPPMLKAITIVRPTTFDEKSHSESRIQETAELGYEKPRSVSKLTDQVFKF
ncbi:hypothetical protein DFQ30_011456 [Apophysomyces sp. BC1015]|nr:hypothetical protein DFQ30_011456 [Apophysomyces sp. BC1015]